MIRKKYFASIGLAGIEQEPERYYRNLSMKILFFSFLFALLFGAYQWLSGNNLLWSAAFFLGSFILLQVFSYFRILLKASSRIRRMESVFPDVIQLMASNLRAGMTVDRAFLLSARAEFAPLDGEILRAGKDIATGKDIGSAFREMARRTGSDKIAKTISLIISGIRSGGNISLLLEQTASNMREKEFIEKRIASSVLMYVIFIFFAVAIGAPLLFGLSSVLVEVLIKIIGSLPEGSASTNLPFSLSQVNISPEFIKGFALLFILATDILASLILGIVSKGDEKSGLKFLIPLLAVSYGLFFLVRIVLRKFLLENLALNF